MTRFRWHVTRSFMAVMALAPLLAAQQAAPRAGYVYPAGGRQGTTFDVAVGGQFLNGANNVYVSGNGVQASVAEYARPLNGMQVNAIREQLKALMAKRGTAGNQQPPNAARPATPGSPAGRWTPEDAKTAIELRNKLAESFRRLANPAISETVTLHVTIAPGAAAGERELRLGTATGLTNPVLFCVGELPEVSRKPAGVGQFQGPPRLVAGQPASTAPQPATDISLPVVLNGQIMPGAVDRYHFRAHRGQRLVAAASARTLMPYIADAVPGWFQAMLALRDPDGKEVQYADHFRFDPDPVIYYEVPRDGEYELDIRDSIYRGRDDFVYRIALGELPYLTGIFPLGGKAGAKTRLELQGWNLPVARLTQSGAARTSGIVPVSLRKGEWTSNSVPFTRDMLPEITEKESRGQKQSVRQIKVPVIVNGRIGRPGEWDVFRLKGRAGEEIVAEVFARRLGSPLDSILKLVDARERELISNDDFEDKGAGLLTHQADSRIAFKLPANGTYYLRLGDVQGQGGAEYAYRLRIRHPQPDFELRVAPSSINVRSGASVPITVYALRQDGFAGDIKLQLKDAPPGFTLEGGVIPANQDKVRLTLTVPQRPMPGPRPLSLEGAAIVQGSEVRRPALPADDRMQAFAYHHLVPAQELLVSVLTPGRAPARWKPFGGERLRVPAGSTAEVLLAVGPQLRSRVQVALDDPPDGLSVQNVSPAPDGVAVRFQAAAGKLKPGDKGNLILNAFVEVQPPNAPAGAPKRRQPLGALPAIPFEVFLNK